MLHVLLVLWFGGFVQGLPELDLVLNIRFTLWLGPVSLGLLLGSRSKFVTADCAGDRASSRGAGDWPRDGKPRNSVSSRRVSSSKLRWRPFRGGSATGSRLGEGGSPFLSGVGRRAALGAGRRMMLGSITRSFRPPTITRCSILSCPIEPVGKRSDFFPGKFLYPGLGLRPRALDCKVLTAKCAPSEPVCFEVDKRGRCPVFPRKSRNKAAINLLKS